MLNILKALLAALLSVFGLGVTLLVITCVIFAAIFGEMAIWIVRIVLIVLIAKFVLKMIW